MTTQLAELERATIRDLFIVGVQLEAAAQCFCEGLAKMFAHCPEVAAFWRLFAADEVLHAKGLTDLPPQYATKAARAAVSPRRA